ncbi:MAG: hypothetical protein ABFS46_06665 [Myxococcota bacterium]
MAQLALFQGSHLPRTAAREALSRGELGRARAQLAQLADTTEEAADAARLERITSALRASNEDPVGTLHDAFISALAKAEPRGFLSDAEWFRCYAQRMAGALEAEPGRRFRGWLGAHFAFVAGEVDAAQRSAGRIVESLPPGSAWIEAARLAFEFGEAAKAREWIRTACLDGPSDLAPEPPALERCEVSALDAAPPLPPLPAPVDDAFEAARALGDLPGPWTRWVAVVGEIDHALAPVDPSNGEPFEALANDGDAARAFLAALRAARRSRERDGARGPDHCSDRELRARRRMQRLAPELLARYLRDLDGSLF